MTTSRASRASTGARVLPGGSTGQVLTKSSGTNDDLVWATPAAGGGGGSGTPSDGFERALAADQTTSTLATWIEVTGLTKTYTPAANGWLMVKAKVRMNANANGDHYARVSISPAPAAGGSPALNPASDEGVAAGIAKTAYPSALWPVVSGTAYTIKVEAFNSAGTLTIRGDANNYTEVFGLFVPGSISSGGGVTTGTDTTLAASPQTLAVAAKSQVFGTKTITPVVDSLLVIHATATISNSPTGNQGAFFGPLVASPQTGGTLTGGRFSAGPAPVSPGITSMNQTIQNPLSGSTFGDTLYYLRAGVTYTIGYDLQAGSGAGSVTFSNIQSTYSTTPFGGGGSSGSWTTYTPADIAAVTTNPSLGTGATKTGQYLNDGTTVKADIYYKVGTSPSAGLGAYKFAFPVPLVGFFPGIVVGHGWMYTAGGGVATQQVLALDANFYHLFQTAGAAWEFTSGNNAGWWAVGNEMAHHLDYRIR